MRQTYSWFLMLGLVGCGQSDPAPHTASAPTPTITAPVSDLLDGPQKITPEEAVKLAQELIQKQDFNTASQLLGQAIQADPKLVDAYTTRASIFSEAKLYTRAILDMDVAIKLVPENPKFYNTRGYFSLMLQDNGPAMEDFNQAIALDPNYAQPQNNRGLARISISGYQREMGEVDKAEVELGKSVKEFDNAIKLDPKYVDAHNNRGFALSLAKKYDEAIASFTKAIDIDGTYVNAWNNRAQAQALAGRHELAIADFTQAIKLHPTTMEYYQQRAESYVASGHPERARKDLDHVEWSYELDELNRQLNAEPKNPMNWVARGNHLEQVDRWDEALQNFSDALKLDQDCTAAQVGRATVMYRQGKLDEALTAVNTILKSGDNRDAASLRGDILNQQGQYDAAIADYKVAQRFDSRVAQAYAKRSGQRKASGDIQQASADMVQAIWMDPSLRAGAPDVPAEEAAVKEAPGAFPVDAVDSTPIEPAPSDGVVPAAAESVAP